MVDRADEVPEAPVRAVSEGGIGWIPYFRERIDYTYDRHRYWTGMDRGDRMPSKIMDEQVICCWIDDPVGVDMRHKMNIDMICWECDYPHSDSSWPQSPEAVWKQMQASNCSDEDIDKITHANAMRLYKFDPFSTLGGKENCTVGALREQAGDWDVSIVSRGHQGHRHRRAGPPELRQGRPLPRPAQPDFEQVTQSGAPGRPSLNDRSARSSSASTTTASPGSRLTMNDTMQSSHASVCAITQSPQSIVSG